MSIKTIVMMQNKPSVQADEMHREQYGEYEYVHSLF